MQPLQPSGSLLTPRSTRVDGRRLLPWFHNQTSSDARTLLAELRDEVNTRLGDFQAQIQTAVNQVNEHVQEAHDLASTAAMEAEALTVKQDHRILQVENTVQQLSVSIVTKADLTGALSAAMEQQSKELRALLAKGSADATPTSDRKAQRTA